MKPAEDALPLILAGPLLRRLETNRIALWLVTTQDIQVRLRFGRTVCHPNVRTIKASPKLFYHLIDGILKKPFPQDEWIKYKIELRHDDTNWENITELDPDLLYPGQDSLGFQIPSRVSTILHGSCRKPHHPSGDGLVEADNFLQKLLNGERKDTDWPSMLVLCGDQIYADDVAAPTLSAIHSLIGTLQLPSEDLSQLDVPYLKCAEDVYQHPNCYYGRGDILPYEKGERALFDMLFEGVRKPIFTTDTAHNHLITLHEHLMMYLLVWSPYPWGMSDIIPPENMTPEQDARFRDEKEILDEFVAGLDQVRRLLAHIPVAMIFDDHDVTDDWNLNRQWEQAVYGHPFSKRMIANGLSAYLLCQGWGNNPDGFDTQMLDRLSQTIEAPGSAAHLEFTQNILDFQGWEYQWETTPPLIVLDTRTRRWRSESSMVKPSGLLDWEALIELQQHLFDKENVILVAPAPIFGVKLIEGIQRLFTWLGKPLVVDAENWMAHPGTANSILNIFMHSKTPQNVTILSGDVHYSFVYDVELKKQLNGPDIWQVTSSGLKNEFPATLLDRLDLVNRWLFSPRSPLNWFTRRRRMRIIPRKPEGHEDGRRLLNAAGIGLVELDVHGKPWRFRQLTCEHGEISFNRMEHHSRWD